MEGVEVLALPEVSPDVQWVHFPKYEKLLWKITWLWVVKFRGKYQPQELFNELVLAYDACSKTYRSSITEPSIKSRLWKTCWNWLVDLCRKERIEISIDDVIVQARDDEWRALWGRFFAEDVKALLRTDGAREMVEFVLYHTDQLQTAMEQRRGKVIQRRQQEHKPVRLRKFAREFCREDVAYYFVRVQGWKWEKVWDGFDDVNQALQLLQKTV